MNAAHIHLILNHFVVVGLTIAIGILIFGFFYKNKTIEKLALVLLIITAILTIPVFFSGEEAEEIVENIEGVSETLIEEHEELAEKAVWVMGFLGLISLVNFYTIISKKPFSRKITGITLLISLITFGIFLQIANLGGQIRHSEIRNVTEYQTEDNSKEKYNGNKHDDD